MSYYSRQNPFKRQTTLIPEPYPRFYWLENNNNKDPKANQDMSYKSKIIDSPFEKSKFEDVFSGRNNKSESKIFIKNGISDYTNFPLSRHDNQMKLRQIDNQSWKRQMFAEQKYKLDHFGPDALRYTNYSTEPVYENRSYSESKLGYNKKNQYQSNLGQQRNQNKYSQNPQSSYMLYFDKSQNVNKKSYQQNTSISNNKMSNHNSGYFGRSNQQISTNHKSKAIQNHYDSEKRNYKKNQNEKNNGYDGRVENNYNNNRNQNKSNVSSYNQNEYWNSRKPKNKQDEFSLSSRQKQFQNSLPNKRGEKKQTRMFMQSRQYMENSFNKSSQQGFNYQAPFGKQGSSKSFDSNSDLIGQINNSKNLANKGKQMSYGSNFEKDRPNFEDSDLINQSDLEQQKNISKAMKFSSSFDEDNRQKKVAPSHFAFRKDKKIDKIIYQGREYFYVNIC